jgi:co-chaperonin GroES (HSP10)
MFESKDLGQVRNAIEHKNAPQIGRSSIAAKNMTANVGVEQIKPNMNRAVIDLKAWPSQSANGIFMPESYTIIRGELYVAEVVAVGPTCKLLSKGDAVILSMYSGHHITTKGGHSKIITDSDVLLYKSKTDMEKTQSYDPKTFTPGINYILIEMIDKKTIKTEGGIIVETGDDDAFNKVDVATKSAKIVSMGETDQYGTKYDDTVIGKTIIIDAYVGLAMNAADIADSEKYKVILSNDILAFVDKETQQ